MKGMIKTAATIMVVMAVVYRVPAIRTVVIGV